MNAAPPTIYAYWQRGKEKGRMGHTRLIFAMRSAKWLKRRGYSVYIGDSKPCTRTS